MKQINGEKELELGNFNQYGSRREPQWRKRRSQSAGHDSSPRRSDLGQAHSDSRGYSGSRQSGRGNGKWNDSRGGKSRYDRNDRSGRYRAEREDERSDRRQRGQRSGRSWGSGKNNGRAFEQGFRRGGRRFDGGRDERREREAQDSRTGKHSYGVRDSRYRAKEWRHENEPKIPPAVKASDLDRESRVALSSLDPDNAEKVARHLVMAGSLLDVDAEEAYLHAKAAVSRAGRIGTVREAAALAAYGCGKYNEALREVRAARRLNGTDSLRAIEADCERGLGKPEKALEIIAETDTSSFNLSDLVELVIVQAGARHDLGESDAALVLLNNFLDNYQPDEPVLLARILSYKADLLREIGREDEAQQVEEETPEVPDTVAIVD